MINIEQFPILVKLKSIRQILNTIIKLIILIIYSLNFIMISLRNKSERTSSNVLFNKENNFQFANKLLHYNRKNFNCSKEEYKIDDLKTKKTEFPLIKKYLGEQPKPLNKEHKTQPELTHNQIDIKQIENKYISTHYSRDILDCLRIVQKTSQPRQILDNHTISKELRSKMVDWMIEVLSSYKCSQNSFFTAVRIMDSFFMKSKIPHESSELHLTGITCIFMAGKYEQIYPLKLKVIYEKIAHKKISKQNIIKKEGEILSTLNFDIVGVNNYELLNQSIYMSELQQMLDNKNYLYLKKICLYLSKMVLYDLELLNVYEYSTLSAANIYVAFKIIEQVDPTFEPDENIKDILRVLKVKESQMIQAATKILTLAKSFQKIYPNLTNLKRFHGFALMNDQPLSCRETIQ